MAYVSQWERLSDAVTRVTAMTKVSPERAQVDICRAIADRDVDFRGTLKKHFTRPMTSKSVLERAAFEIPRPLKPEDLDWEHSRPLKPWLVKPWACRQPGWWELRLIEVSRAPIDALFGIQGHGDQAGQPASRAKPRKPKAGPQRERACRALKERFPQGVPDQTVLRNKELCKQVTEKLELGLPAVSDDTILRAAGRRK
jgi:hypothetical protein